MLGLRGVGKTVLLNRFEEMAEVLGCETSLIEAPEGRSLPELLVPALRRVLRRLDRREAARDYTRRATEALVNFAKAFKISYEGIDLSFEGDSIAAGSGELEFDLAELFILVGRAAERAERPVVLLVDEIQYLSQADLAALIVALHRVSQKVLPVVFFGGGLPQLAALAGEAKSYAERLFEFAEVGPLEDSEANNAIVAPLARNNVAIDPAALAQIREATHGYPYFVQVWGKHVWDVAEGTPIEEADALTAGARALTRLDEGFFNVRYERMTPREQDYVKAMADLGRPPHASGDIAQRMGVSRQQASSIKRSLTEKGMVYSPSHGQTAFTVPLFDEYVERRTSRS